MSIALALVGAFTFALGFLLPSIKRWIDSKTDKNLRH